jgi:hypothetical protein
MPGNKQDIDHPSSSAVQWHSGMIWEDSWRAPVVGHFDTPERLSQEAMHLPADLQSINPWDHRHDDHQNGVWERATPALPPVVWGCTQQGVVYNHLHGRPRELAAWHHPLCPSAFNGSQWPDEGPLWPPREFHGIAGGRRPRQAVPPDPGLWNVAYAPAILVRPIRSLGSTIQGHPRVQMMVVHLGRLVTPPFPTVISVCCLHWLLESPQQVCKHWGTAQVFDAMLETFRLALIVLEISGMSKHHLWPSLRMYKLQELGVGSVFHWLSSSNDSCTDSSDWLCDMAGVCSYRQVRREQSNSGLGRKRST